MFVNEPGPGPILSPVWTPVQLNCTVEEGYRAHWSVTLPDRSDPTRTNVMDVTEYLMMRGIKARNTGSQMSQLIFNGNNSNSPATVKCFAVNTTLMESDGTPVEVIFYGKNLEVVWTTLIFNLSQVLHHPQLT